MKKFLKTLFAKNSSNTQSHYDKFTEKAWEDLHQNKAKGLEHVLGQMHEVVGHAIIGFEVGGSVDMYYFPNHIPGTGFATMELILPDGTGPRPNRIGTFELVAFTRHTLLNDSFNESPYNLVERRICGSFTAISNYALQIEINPHDTFEIPGENGKENKYFILDAYLPNGKEFLIKTRKHHLLLCLEIFRSELEYAREHGSLTLLEKLHNAGFYPYSDLDRNPVAI